jgi:MoxR-like ATPase
MSDTSNTSVSEAKRLFETLSTEMTKVIIGQEDVIEKIAIALFCRGHVLLVGPPGMAKTLLVQTFASALDLPFGRIQFTPDLMPSDILGTEILQEDRATGRKEWVFTKGPIFTQILLADEINRTPPKTQAALLQAMQEKTVTLFGRTEILAEPFMVLATQNPIEQEGTYPLPEAQLDRFLFSIDLDYPSRDQELAIARLHTRKLQNKVQAVLGPKDILRLQEAVLAMTIPEHVFELAVSWVRATRPTEDNPVADVRKYVRWGAGPRSLQYLLLAAKARALLHGRPMPIEEDLKVLFPATMAHRIHLNFHAEAENLDTREILNRVLCHQK